MSATRVPNQHTGTRRPFRDLAQLEQALTARGWSVADLSEHSGVSQRALYAAFRGGSVHMKTRAKVIRALAENPPTAAISAFLASEGAA